MTSAAVLERFDRLAIWKRGHQRAPHKLLLVLYALARWSRGDQADVPFGEVDRDLTQLLKEFGPPRHSYHPEYPFWRLQNHGVWNVASNAPLRTRQSNTDPPKSALLSSGATGRFSEEVKALRAAPSLVGKIAGLLLERHFPESIHPDILQAVGLDLTPQASGRKRDSGFRKRVLTAYEYGCAVCGFDVRLGSVSIALDAAHIRWVQAGGPDEESNGLALCVLHHKLFDLGAFTLGKDGRLLVSDQAHGSSGFDEMLMRHHGRVVRRPQRPEWHPQAVTADAEHYVVGYYHGKGLRNTRVVTAEGHKEIAHFNGPKENVSGGTITSDGRCVVSGGLRLAAVHRTARGHTPRGSVNRRMWGSTSSMSQIPSHFPGGSQALLNGVSGAISI
jgi:putative restriction endonuclease